LRTRVHTPQTPLGGNIRGPATSVAARFLNSKSMPTLREREPPGREFRGPCRALPVPGRPASGGTRPVHLYRGHAFLPGRPGGGTALPFGADRGRRRGFFSSSCSSLGSWIRDGRWRGLGLQRASLGDGAGDEASGIMPCRWSVAYARRISAGAGTIFFTCRQQLFSLVPAT